MKIKKNGKVIKLTESDLQRIVKRVLNEDNEKDVSKTLKCCRDARLPDSQIPKSCKEGNVEGCKKDLFASNPKTNEKYIAISCIDDGKNNSPSHHSPTR